MAIQKKFAEKIVHLLKNDENVIGLAAVGSWLTDEIDEFSDLDLILVTKEKISGEKNKMLAYADRFGEFLSGFTGEHVGEPRVLICLYDNPGVTMIAYYGYIESTTGKQMTSAMAKMLLGNPFAFPETWHTIAWLSSFFILLPSILVIMMVTNEYTFRTHRQNIIDGWSRQQFISSKLCDVAIVAATITLVYTIVAALFGVYADNTMLYQWSRQLQYILLFFLQTFAQLSIAFLLALKRR